MIPLLLRRLLCNPRFSVGKAKLLRVAHKTSPKHTLPRASLLCLLSVHQLHWHSHLPQIPQAPCPHAGLTPIPHSQYLSVNSEEGGIFVCCSHTITWHRAEGPQAFVEWRSELCMSPELSHSYSVASSSSPPSFSISQRPLIGPLFSLILIFLIVVTLLALQ